MSDFLESSLQEDSSQPRQPRKKNRGRATGKSRRDNSRRQNSGRPSNRRGPLPPPHSRKRRNAGICVYNISPSVSEDDLYRLFRDVGPVASTKLARDENKNSQGFAIVEYRSMKDAVEAVRRYHNQQFDRKKIFLTLLSNSNPSSSNHDSNLRNQRKKPNPKPKSEKTKRKPLTAEDLDAGIESYRSQSAHKDSDEHLDDGAPPPQEDNGGNPPPPEDYYDEEDVGEDFSDDIEGGDGY